MQLLETFQRRDELRPLAFFRELDGYFPPLMHLLSTPFAALGGHTDTAAAHTAILWLFLLAWAVGAVTWQLGRDRSVAVAAATGTLLLPAAHAFATRYYYDVPFTAALWLVVAAALATWDRRPVVGGLLAALLWFLAALVKWTSLVFGLFMVLGVWLTSRAPPLGEEESQDPARPPRELRWVERTLALVIAGLGSGALILGYLVLQGPESSLRVMLDQMWGDFGSVGFEAGFGGEAVGGAAAAFQGWIQEHEWGLLELPAGKWSFYGVTLVTAVFSPLLTLPLLLLVGRWLHRSRAGAPLFLVTIVGHCTFFVIWIYVIDERFLLTLAPCFVIAAALGWGTLGPRVRRGFAAFVLVAGLWVALDFHLGVPFPDARILILEPETSQVQPTYARGLGLADSAEQRGWARWDSEQHVPPGERERIWRYLVDCGAPVILNGPGLRDERALGAYWLGYRLLLAERVEGVKGLYISNSCSNRDAAGLAVTRHAAGADPEPGACLDGRDWIFLGTRAAPASTDILAFWTVEAELGGCTSRDDPGG
jgi:hypothetical protein